LSAGQVKHKKPRPSARKNVPYLDPAYSAIDRAKIPHPPPRTANGVRFDPTGRNTKKRINAAAPHGVKTNQRGTRPNVYSACAATIRSGVSEPTTITTGRTLIISGSS